MADQDMAIQAPPGAEQIEAHRAELLGYCYRMLGSAFEAEDAVQETMVRAWRSASRFRGDASVRTWLFRIATNVCLDSLKAAKRRARPMDLSGPAGPADPGSPLDDAHWIGPFPGAGAGAGTDPAAAAASRESVHLAFVAALQHLPATQRSVLLLREVLRFPAAEVAELQQSSVASVNSSLQRARATLAARHRDPSGAVPAVPAEPVQRALAERYVDAFTRYDMTALTLLLHVDAALSLPPYAAWMRGPRDIEGWLTGPAIGCRGSRLIATTANGAPAFGQYRPATGGRAGFEPWALQVLEISGERISGLSFFLDTERLFPLFGLPERLDGPDPG